MSCGGNNIESLINPLNLVQFFDLISGLIGIRSGFNDERCVFLLSHMISIELKNGCDASFESFASRCRRKSEAENQMVC